MKAVFLVKNGPAEESFEIHETDPPKVMAGEVRIKVEGFGLNFADVMARLGLYDAAPPLPSVLGYDVVGRIEQIGTGVEDLKVGDRVTAMTRFGGYAELAVTDHRAVVKIPKNMDCGIGTALSTQGVTAYYCAGEMVRLRPGDHVLIHAAAGGVGTLLVQLAKHKGCTVYGTAGSDPKLQYLHDLGVDYPINYRKKDFASVIKKIRGKEGLDVVFDPVGGKSVKKGFELLGAGGRLVAYGASSLTNSKSAVGKLRVGVGFGMYHPAKLITQSKSLHGVNILQIADNKPALLKHLLEQSVSIAQKGILNPKVAASFPAEQISGAHHFLESRQSMGKVVVKW